MNDWQLVPLDEGTIDPDWFSKFLAIDHTFPLHDAAASDPNIHSIDDSANNTNYHGFPIEETANSTRNLSSPGYYSDAILGQSTEHERPLTQRQHTLPRRRSKYMMRRSTGTSSPIVIPGGGFQQDQEQSPAIQRWRNSPPEDEAASLSAIYHALEDQPMRISPRISRPSSGDAFRTYRGPSSTASLDSAASESSLRSGNSSHQSTQQRKKQGKKHARSRAHLQMYFLLRHLQAQVRLDAARKVAPSEHGRMDVYTTWSLRRTAIDRQSSLRVL